MARRTGRLASPLTLALAAALLAALSLSGAPQYAPTAVSQLAPDGRRVAIAALEPTAESEVSPLAGRAPYFLIFEGGVGLIDAIANDFAQEEKTAGARAAYLVSAMGVDCLVAGEVGPRMDSVLRAEDVCFVTARGQAEAVAARLLARGM